MLTAMTEEDWTIVLKVFEASRSRRGDKGRNDRKFLEALQYFVVSQHHLAAGGGGRLGVGPARGLTLLSSLPRIATNSASSSMALHPRPSGETKEPSRKRSASPPDVPICRGLLSALLLSGADDRFKNGTKS
jgi:hypothetical protein